MSTEHEMAKDTDESPGLRDMFPSHFLPDPTELRVLLSTGIVALDTNALFELYRFNRQSRSEFISVLELLNERLWVPYQVAQEFLRGRLSVIEGMTAATEAFVEEMSDFLNQSIQKFRSFGNRRGLSSAQLSPISERLEKAYDSAVAEITALCKPDIDLDSAIRNDDILHKLEPLLRGKIGGPLENEAAARQEAASRLERRIPPGYMDAKKNIDMAVGDCLLWFQLIEEAKSRKKPVILVSNDQKGDWVRIERGRKLGPRIELVDEMRAKTGVSFYMMSVQSFLLHVRTFLGATISDNTVIQAERLDLTKLELDMLESLCRPLGSEPFAVPSTRREIAADLEIAEEEVALHLFRLYGKFKIPEVNNVDGFTRRHRLANRALELGIVPQSEADESPSP